MKIILIEFFYLILSQMPKNVVNFLEHSSPCKFFQVWIVLIAFEAIIENWNTKTSLNTAIKEHIQQILLLPRVCVTYLKYNVYEKILLIKTACQSILNTDKCVAVAFTFKMYVVRRTHIDICPNSILHRTISIDVCFSYVPKLLILHFDSIF